MLYSDQSVLERSHAAQGAAVLSRCGLLSGLSRDEAALFRKIFIAAILATDMSVHRKLLADTQELCDAAEAEAGAAAAAAADAPQSPSFAAAAASTPPPAVAPQPFRGGDDVPPERRTLAVSFLLHCADLCCPLMDVRASQRVAASLSLEFASQAAAEARLGLPITVVVAENAAAKAKLELSFLRFVVSPLFACLARAVPRLHGLLGRVHANTDAWQRVLDAAKAEAAKSGLAGGV